MRNSITPYLIICFCLVVYIAGLFIIWEYMPTAVGSASLIFTIVYAGAMVCAFDDD